MRTLTDEEKERLMEELIKSIKDAHTQYPYELTAKEFADKIGRSYSCAKKLLSKQVAEGKMTKRRITVDKKTLVVYSVI